MSSSALFSNQQLTRRTNMKIGRRSPAIVISDSDDDMPAAKVPRRAPSSPEASLFYSRLEAEALSPGIAGLLNLGDDKENIQPQAGSTQTKERPGRRSRPGRTFAALFDDDPVDVEGFAPDGVPAGTPVISFAERLGVLGVEDAPVPTPSGPSSGIHGPQQPSPVAGWGLEAMGLGARLQAEAGGRAAMEEVKGSKPHWKPSEDNIVISRCVEVASQGRLLNDDDKTYLELKLPHRTWSAITNRGIRNRSVGDALALVLPKYKGSTPSSITAKADAPGGGAAAAAGPSAAPTFATGFAAASASTAPAAAAVASTKEKPRLMLVDGRKLAELMLKDIDIDEDMPYSIMKYASCFKCPCGGMPRVLKTKELHKMMWKLTADYWIGCSSYNQKNKKSNCKNKFSIEDLKRAVEKGPVDFCRTG